MAFEAGQQLLHYRLIEELGRGGMGEVWKAVDTTLDREVAIKVLSDDAAHDAGRIDRFRREARALAALDHPAIVTVHSVERTEGVHFLTMSFVDGRTLDDDLQMNRGLRAVTGATLTATVTTAASRRVLAVEPVPGPCLGREAVREVVASPGGLLP